MLSHSIEISCRNPHTTVTATTWAIVTAMRLVGNKKSKGGLQGQWQRQCEGGGRRRGRGQQGDGNGDGNKDVGQVERDGNKEVDGDGNKCWRTSQPQAHSPTSLAKLGLAESDYCAESDKNMQNTPNRDQNISVKYTKPPKQRPKYISKIHKTPQTETQIYQPQQNLR